MAADLEKVTKGVEVMLHLLRYSRFRDDHVCPYEMTQRGIAETLGIRREHATMILIRFQKRGYIDHKIAHVAGSGANRKAYYLTTLGEKIAKQLRERTGEAGEAWSEANGGVPEKCRPTPEMPNVADAQGIPHELLKPK